MVQELLSKRLKSLFRGNMSTYLIRILMAWIAIFQLVNLSAYSLCSFTLLVHSARSLCLTFSCLSISHKVFSFSKAKRCTQVAYGHKTRQVEKGANLIWGGAVGAEEEQKERRRSIWIGVGSSDLARYKVQRTGRRFWLRGGAEDRHEIRGPINHRRISRGGRSARKRQNDGENAWLSFAYCAVSTKVVGWNFMICIFQL